MLLSSMSKKGCSAKSTPNDYFRPEKLLLQINGVSVAGNNSTAYKIYSFFILTVVKLPYPFVAFGDIFKHDFNSTARLFLYIVAAHLATIMLFAMFKNRIKLGKIMQQIENAPFIPNLERGGEREEQLVTEWATFHSKQRFTLYSIAVVATVVGTGFSLLTRLTNSDPEEWTFPYGPLTVLNVTSSPNYELSWVYQNVCMLLAISIAILFSITVAGLLAFVSVQFQILQNSISKLVHYSQRKALQDKDGCASDTPSWKYLKLAIKDTVSYHLQIFELLNELEQIFSFAMLATYLGISGILCFMLYVTTLFSFKEIDFAIAKVSGEAVAVVMMVLLMCYWGEQVSYQSEMVGQAVYESDFIGTDLRFQKALVIIIRRSQYPARIKAGNFVENSLATFMWLLRTSYSCCMILRKTKQL